MGDPIKINPEFRDLIPALQKDELEQLEKSIIDEGCRESIVLWGDTIVDGHNRYEICSRHNISFRSIQKEFESEDHAKLWMIDNQLGRRNLTDFVRIEYNWKRSEVWKKIGKANMKTGGGDRKSEEYQKSGLSILTNPISEQQAPKEPVIEPINTREMVVKASGKSAGTVHAVQKVMQSEDERLLNASRSGDISINEASKLAKLEPEHRQKILEKVEAGEKALEAIKAVKPNIIHSSESNEWYTPEQYIKLAHELMGAIDLDPASCEQANQTVKAHDIYTANDDGFDVEWHGRVWLNPPYGKSEQGSNQAIWSKKLIDEYQAGRVTEGLLLVNSATGNKWFSSLWQFPICFVNHRIRFISPNNEKSQPTHSNAIVYLGHQRDRFIKLFSEIGVVAGRLSA